MESEALDRCVALHELSAQERRAIAVLGRRISVPPGQTVWGEGNHGDSVGVVPDGQFEVCRGGRQVAIVGPGSILGETAHFNENVRTSEVRALTPGILLNLPAAELTRLVLEHEPAS